MASKQKLEIIDFHLPKKVKLNEDAPELETKIKNIDSTVFALVLLVRIQCLGNFREFGKTNGNAGAGADSKTSIDAMFTFTAQDSDAKVIRIAAFNEEAYKYQHCLKEGALYKISKFMIRPAPRNKKIQDTYYEIELGSVSEVEPIEDIPEFAPLSEEKFTDIAKIKLLQDGMQISIKGEVIEAGDKTLETAKESKSQYHRQEVAINDGTREMTFALWGPCIEKVEVVQGQTVILRNVTVTTWKGKKQASIQFDTTLTICN